MDEADAVDSCSVRSIRRNDNGKIIGSMVNDSKKHGHVPLE